jgi:hypothetical protein
LKFENFYWANILGISFDDAVTIGRPSASQETHGLYYKHCYDCTLTTLEVVNAVACNINTIMIIIDDFDTHYDSNDTSSITSNHQLRSHGDATI